MIYYHQAIILIAVIFYIIIPGTGAFVVRKNWRDFRKKLIASSNINQFDFHTFRTEQEKDFPGVYKFYGILEAVQDKYEVWLRSGNFTVSVDMHDVKIYMIPAFSFPEKKDGVYEENREIIVDEVPQIISWDRFYSISQGTDVMVCGPLFVKKGKAIFRNTESEKITFLIYDGKPETLLRRGIWAGRHRNEYWNYFTPASLVAGSFALFIAAYYLYSIPGMKNLSLAALSFSMVPYMPLFPPGAAFFFLYRFLWKKGRFFRAERDLLLLPLSLFNADELKKDKSCTEINSRLKYCFHKFSSNEEAEEICRDQGIKIRTAGFNRNSDSGNSIYYYFRPEFEGEQTRRDPVFESVIIKGDPVLLSEKCRKLSKLNEYSAVAVLAAGIAVNFIITYYFLQGISG